MKQREAIKVIEAAIENTREGREKATTDDRYRMVRRANQDRHASALAALENIKLYLGVKVTD